MSGLTTWTDLSAQHWKITLTYRDAREMNSEQREMLADALWLVQAATRGDTEGPLTLPRTGLPVRN